MSWPGYYPGDEVLLGDGSEVSKYLRGEFGIVVKRLVPSTYYRVYIPEYNIRRSIRGSSMSLLRGVEDVPGRYGDSSERRGTEWKEKLARLKELWSEE